MDQLTGSLLKGRFPVSFYFEAPGRYINGEKTLLERSITHLPSKADAKLTVHEKIAVRS